MDLLTTAGNILLVAAGFGLLIFVHEAGHFLAAKWAGIRTHAFAIGFGPPIVSWRRGIGWCRGSTDRVIANRFGRSATQMTDKELVEEELGETEYSIRWLPLGGFVRMLGQDDLDPTLRATDPRSFGAVSIGRRMIVISAGVVMNVLLAVLCFILAFAMGVPVEAPIIGDIAPGSPAASAICTNADRPEGLLPGDRIIAIDGEAVVSFVDLQVASGMSIEGQSLLLRVERPGVEQPLEYRVSPEESPATGMRAIGVTPASSLTLSQDKILSPIIQSTIATFGGTGSVIGPGWTLESVDGKSIANWGDLERLLNVLGGRPVESHWGKGDQTQTVQISGQPSWQSLRYPDATSGTIVGWEEGIGGFVPPVQIQRVDSSSPNIGLLQSGDVVLRCGSVVAPRMRAFRDTLAAAQGDSISMSVLRQGQMLDVSVKLTRGFGGGPPKAGVFPSYAWDTTLLASPMKEVGTLEGETAPTLAAGIPDGLLPASRWISVDNHPVANWKDVWERFRAAAAAGSADIAVQIQNPNSETQVRSIELSLTAQDLIAISQLEWKSPLPSFLFDPVQFIRTSDGNPVRALAMGAHETWRFIELTYLTIDRLIRGSVGVDQLHGPVGIVHLGTRVADRGFAWMLFFLAIISVNLAVLNFLPLPIVDGGMFLYLVYEKLRGRPPPAAFQNAAMLVGLLLIGTAFFVTFYNDLIRLLG